MTTTSGQAHEGRAEAPEPTAVVIGTATHVGWRRDHNEDVCAHDAHRLVVADGMGGHAAGEVAAALCADTLLAAPEPTNVHDVEASISGADAIITFTEDDDTAGMGCTVVVGALIGGRWAVTWAGDSRAYALSEAGPLVRLTHDHTEPGQLLRQGRISEAEARAHPMGHRLLNCVGAVPGVVAESVEVPEGTRRLILCSDGLTDPVPDELIAAIAGDLAVSAQSIADRLVGAALARGGPDNVTVIVADLT